MKQKRNYSLTAKERKQKRMAEQGKRAGNRPDSASVERNNADTAMSAELAMANSQKRSKRTALIIGGVVALAVLLIITALIVPVLLYVVNPYRGYDDVIARFKLSNGMVLEYVIDEDEYDTAATNFIFLATNKYFDNTVFYDAQGGWLRFGGYVDQPRDSSSSSDFSRTNNRSDSESYCKSFTALPNNRFNRVTDKFGYRLRADSNGTAENLLSQLGALTFRYNDSATEFQFFYGDNAETVPNDIAQLKCTMVGHALNNETIKNIQAISAKAQLNTSISGTSYKWKPPTPTIKIESVEVFNLESSKWADFDFLKYISGDDSSGSRRYTSWVGKIN